MKQILFALPLLLHACFGMSQKTVKLNVAAIFREKCVSCHRPGDAAPFSLVTYADIAKRTALIKSVIESNYMPPWRADDHFRDYSNNRSLSKNEKQAIISWIANGAPKAAFLQEENPVVDSLVTSYNRKPDLILKTAGPFIVKGDNSERFVVFKVPYEADEGKNIEAVEFYCNNKKIVHHINYGFFDVPDSTVDIYGDAGYIDTDRAGDSIHQYDKYYKGKINYYTGWIPGSSYESYPKGIGWKLPKRGVVLLTVHYSAIAADAASVVGVNLFFAQTPVQRQVAIISLGSQGIGERDITPPLLIPPNRTATFSLQVKTADPQSIMYVWPHMHYTGKDFTAYAVTPANDTINLVHIPDWDFRWQELYKMKKFVAVPAGSLIHMSGTYDNTANNPFNPNSPPQFIYSTNNMKATDEMFTLIMIYVPYQPGDEKVALE